ncbi:hypothetical protein E0493_22505 [Roseomonas sp. M0104]|uniref:PLL-like beta propeller domain-containing protein n=1 Tax=Teichococcus coralli TaxID=2545983 RepID=A0A845BJ78_9PROT|nr:hypothetical protein [Pseudoroseomonas coralli]MXP66114.1 hypothetical protein [Pseudoroseomonas coralli]
MPVSDADHHALYVNLRAEILTRFFAYGRLFRTNQLALDHILKYPAPEQEVDRWSIDENHNDNPGLNGCLLVAALAGECAVGHGSGALPILRLYAETLEDLFKFKDHSDPVFHGYPIRWDERGTDRWATRARPAGGPDELVRCKDFVLDHRGHHLYCTPFHHPEYELWRPSPSMGLTPNLGSGNDPHDGGPDNRWQSIERFRRHEPSMDEVVGLVATYAVMADLSGDVVLARVVRGQASRLGDYLAGCGYLLVRPEGGLTARGATGILPALEFPFGRVFQRLTGDRRTARADFVGAMKRAGAWPGMQETMDRLALLGLTTDILAPLAPMSMSARAVLDQSNADLMRVLGALLTSYGHDVMNAEARVEVPLACLMSQVGDPQRRFGLWMHGPNDMAEALGVMFTILLAEGGVPGLLVAAPVREGLRNLLNSIGSYGFNFAPFLGLSCIGDRDRTVRNAFLDHLRNSASKRQRGWFGNTGFARAVGAALGDRASAEELREWLDDAYSHISAAPGSGASADRNYDGGDGGRIQIGIHVEGEGPDKVEKPKEGLVRWWPPNDSQWPLGSLEYIACLSLARYASARELVPEGVLPRWPDGAPDPARPVIPAEVLARGPTEVLKGLDEPLDRHFDPFPVRNIEPRHRRAGSPEPRPPAVISGPAEVHEVRISESVSRVALATLLAPGDRVRLEPGGAIRSGVILTYDTPPRGWDMLDSNPKFPFPGGHPYCLLYRLLPDGMFPGGPGWRPLPDAVGFIYDHPRGAPGTLEFRTNDDTPGGGSGAFTCRVEITRAFGGDVSLALGGELRSAPSVASASPGRVDAFALDAVGAVAHYTRVRIPLREIAFWGTVPGTAGLASSPAAYSGGNGAIDLFGLNAEGRLLRKTLEGDTWTPREGWETVATERGVASRPTACSFEAGRLDVFSTDGEGRLMQIVRTGGWTGWHEPTLHPPGFRFAADQGGDGLSAVSWGPRRIDIFGRGARGGLGHAWWDGNRWFGEEFEGAISSAPGVASPAPGRLEVFARLSDGGFGVKVFDRSWSGWAALRGRPESAPAAVFVPRTVEENRVEVFYRGTLNDLRNLRRS